MCGKVPKNGLEVGWEREARRVQRRRGQVKRAGRGPKNGGAVRILTAFGCGQTTN
jgi:hypothetical protein